MGRPVPLQRGCDLHGCVLRYPPQVPAAEDLGDILGAHAVEV